MRKFKAPIDENGKEYWVPVVIKNKDVLVSFLNGVHSVLQAFNYDLNNIDLLLGSERFNDILPNGNRVKNMSDTELLKYIKEEATKIKESTNSHVENDNTILSNYYLSIECTCGMFYGFNNQMEIPDKTCECSICGKKLIIYTKRDDSEFIYDGSTRIDILTSPVNEVEDLLDDETNISNASISDKEAAETVSRIVQEVMNNTSNKSDKTNKTDDAKTLNFELNKKIARSEVIERILNLDSITSDRRTQLNSELNNLKFEITDIIRRLNKLNN